MTNTTEFTQVTFEIKSAFQLSGRQFFILGQIISGTINVGMIADLSSIGIDKLMILESIEFALHRNGDKVWEDVGLGFSNLTESEKAILKSQSPFLTPILITNKTAS